MTPVIVQLHADLHRRYEEYLLIGFCSEHLAVCVKDDGTLTTIPIISLRVEYGNTDWPVGYAFSRAASEREPVA